MSRPHQYFAATNKADIGKKLREKIVELVNDNVNTLREEYATAYRYAYGRDMGFGITSGVTREGEQGELASLRVNYARSNAKAFVAMVTAPGVTWNVSARNADVGAQAATSLGKHILEDEWKNRGLNVTYLQGVEIAEFFSEVFWFPEWDMSLGPVIATVPDPDRPGFSKVVRGGDVRYHKLLPWDVFRDDRAKSFESLSWLFLRVYKNRWDLAAENPRCTDGTPSFEKIISSKENEMLRAIDVGQRGVSEKTDQVPVWYFFHKPTPALPWGREVIFVHDECVLRDRALKYCDPADPEWPIVRLAADEMYDSAHGYTQFWDSLGPQEVVDSLETAITTNETSFGVQNIWYEKGTEVHAQDLALGVRAMEIPKGARPPGAVQLTQSPKEIFDHVKILKGDIRQLMGLNDAAMGQPESAQMNAQAFAVLVSMAIQQASPFQKRCIDALSELGTKVLKIKRSRITRERSLQITGASSSSLYAEEKYTGSKLAPVSRVTVEIGNPMEQTAPGRALILQTMAQAGLLHNAEELQQVVETGRIEPATRGLRDELMLIQAEYELLSRGQNPPVHSFQDHPLHCRENASVLANPENLGSPEIVNAVQQHIDAHYQNFFGVPPNADPQRLDRMRFLLGQGPMPAPMPPPGAPPPPAGAGPGPGGPGGPPPGPHKPGVAPPKPPPAMLMASQAMTPPQGGMPQHLPMPDMPRNPVSGQPFDPTTGGLK